MMFCIEDVQALLSRAGLDGWLLYDYKKTNDLACAFLQIPAERKLTRRLFYWIPSAGQPLKIVSSIEAEALDHLPGETLQYTTWQQLHTALAQLLKGRSKIAMEYSPFNALPSQSKVDGGTLELVRSYGVTVVSSADLLQAHLSVWSKEQLHSHRAAAAVLELAAANSWKLLTSALKDGNKLLETDVQRFIAQQIEEHGCLSDSPPICAVNAHSADPHFTPNQANQRPIKHGDLILIDLWCKKRSPGAVYADITRVGVAAERPSAKQQQIFKIVKEARDAAMHLMQAALQQGRQLQGRELDDACRQVIERAGYGPFFTHRTGHNLGEQVHGPGANIDHFETDDDRILLPGSGFTIEPGIYLPGEFGIRLEHDVYIDPHGKQAQATTMLQSEIEILA